VPRRSSSACFALAPPSRRDSHPTSPGVRRCGTDTGQPRRGDALAVGVPRAPGSDSRPARVHGAPLAVIATNRTRRPPATRLIALTPCDKQ
jgi:hypothetical protein